MWKIGELCGGARPGEGSPCPVPAQEAPVCAPFAAAPLSGMLTGTHMEQHPHEPRVGCAGSSHFCILAPQQARNEISPGNTQRNGSSSGTLLCWDSAGGCLPCRGAVLGKGIEHLGGDFPFPICSRALSTALAWNWHPPLTGVRARMC